MNKRAHQNNISQISAKKSKSEDVCGICFESEELIKICKCNFCIPCLQKYVIMKVETNGEFNILCPNYNCLQSMENYLDKLFDKDRLLQIQNKLTMNYLKYKPQFKCCITPDCSYIVELENNCSNSFYHQCEICKNSWCLNCNSKSHDNNECSKSQEDIINESMLSKTATQCPNCKSWVEKADGCDNLMCKCRTQFCWLCGDIWNRNHLIEKHPNKSNNISASYLLKLRLYQSNIMIRLQNERFYIETKMKQFKVTPDLKNQHEILINKINIQNNKLLNIERQIKNYFSIEYFTFNNCVKMLLNFKNVLHKINLEQKLVITPERRVILDNYKAEYESRIKLIPTGIIENSIMNIRKSMFRTNNITNMDDITILTELSKFKTNRIQYLISKFVPVSIQTKIYNGKVTFTHVMFDRLDININNPVNNFFQSIS